VEFSTGVLALFFTVLIASVVEMVEALTIVLAIGLTRGWRSTLIGSGAAVALLAVLTAILGPLLILIPMTVLHLVVGCVLLIFGLQWLRKAILRAGGFLPLHDEDAVYDRQAEKAKSVATGKAEKIDWYAFTIVFKGVFLEGLEVIFIVLTFGASQRNIPVAAFGALVGIVLVGAAGLIVHRPLSLIPENTLKFIVGIMLTCFGIFWGGSGAGVRWPGDNAAILGLIGVMLVVSLTSVALLRQIAEPKPVGRT
jgi:uncharacterized membrane protein